MNNQILVNVTPQETRVAIIELGVAQELHIERASSRGLVGNIYWGRVARVLPGMQSAFIDLGLEKSAFLHVADIATTKDLNQPIPPIEKLLADGQSILVQVIKDPIGTKGARLSTQISIAGRYLVYLPFDDHIGVSQRIESEEERQLLKDRLIGILPNGYKGGFIIRTVAENTSDQELLCDYDYLTQLWKHITTAQETHSAPHLLYQELNLAQRIIRDFVMDNTDRLLIDSR